MDPIIPNKKTNTIKIIIQTSIFMNLHKTTSGIIKICLNIEFKLTILLTTDF